MKYLRFFQIVLIQLSIIFFSCKKDDKTPDNSIQIENTISNAKKNDVEPKDTTPLFSISKIDTILENNILKTCTTKTVSISTNIDNFQSIYIDNSAFIYPGAIIQGKYLT